MTPLLVLQAVFSLVYSFSLLQRMKPSVFSRVIAHILPKLASFLGTKLAQVEPENSSELRVPDASAVAVDPGCLKVPLLLTVGCHMDSK